MPGLFCDSFNHYGPVVSPKWSFAFSGSIINNAAIARTGPRCLQILGGAFGPSYNLGAAMQVIHYPQVLQGVALNFTAFPSPVDVLHFTLVGAFVQVFNIIVQLNPNGSFSVYRGAGDGPQTLLGTSLTTPFVFSVQPGSNVWNYLECKVLVSRVSGFVELRFAPPTGPMSTILTLSGVNTAALLAGQYCNQVGLAGPGALNLNSYMADYYCLDWSAPPNNDYLGGIRIYKSMPFANGAPVQFTPLAPPNWSQVNEIPPDGDTSYNSSSTVGQVDQYQHNAGEVPVSSQIQFLQHIMDARIDAGARAITSVAGGVVNANPIYLTNNYAMQATFPYDTNPLTALPWAPGDFPFSFGPKVVA